MSDRGFGINNASTPEPKGRGGRTAVILVGGIFAVALAGALVPWLLDKFKNRLSDDQAVQLVTGQLDTSDKQLCLNTNKIKYANNEPMSFGSPPPAPEAPPAPAGTPAPPDQAAAPAPDAPPADNAGVAPPDGGANPADANANPQNTPQANAPDAGASNAPPADAAAATPPPAPAPAPAQAATVAPPPPSDGFPLILAEEKFLQWQAPEKYLMSLLIGGGYISVHSGGYPDSETQKGTPGAPFQVASAADVASIVAFIAQRGAEIDLTDKGRAAHVWDPSAGFCMTAHWSVTGVTQSGLRNISGNRALVHLSAKESLAPKQLGQATADLNPLNLDYGDQDEFDALRDAQGWHIVAPNDPVLTESADASPTQGGVFGNLLGAAIVHELMKDADEKDDSDTDKDAHEDEESGSAHDEDSAHEETQSEQPSSTPAETPEPESHESSGGGSE